MNLWKEGIPFLSMVVAVSICMGSTAPAAENAVRAKIGIQVSAGESIDKAKSRDRLRPGDLLRIYVSPEEDAYVYVIHSDLAQATLLNVVEQNLQGSLVVLPSALEFYRVDGESDQEKFTVICSRDELSQLAGLVANTTLPRAQWAEIEDALVRAGKIELSQDTEKPFALAGNVRGLESPAKVTFADGLPIFSGKGVLVKKYEFAIKK
jgi:hypothetical protein